MNYNKTKWIKDLAAKCHPRDCKSTSRNRKNRLPFGYPLIWGWKVELAGTGHDLPIEAPKKFNKIVKFFLESEQ